VPKPPSKSFTLRIKYPDPDSAGRLSDHVSLPEVISSDRMSKSMLPPSPTLKIHTSLRGPMGGKLR
jgi:hypothetical protein